MEEQQEQPEQQEQSPPAEQGSDAGSGNLLGGSKAVADKTAAIDATEGESPNKEAKEEPKDVTIKVPNAKSTQKEWDKFYDNLRPSSVKDYELEKPDLPDGMNVNDKMQKDMLKVMHKTGLTNRQVNAVLKGYWKRLGTEFSAKQEEARLARSESELNLRQSFGSQYERKVALANKVLDRFGGDEALKELEKKGLANNPSVIKMLAAVGSSISETSLVDKSSNSGGHMYTPEEATRRKNELFADKEFMAKYTDRNQAGYKLATEEISRLTKIIAGEIK